MERGQDQLPAREAFRQHRVAGIAAARRQHDCAQLRAFLDQRLDALLRKPLGQIGRRLNGKKRARHLVDAIADPVVAGFGGAHLRRFHEHDLPGGMRR
jgi:hypothetical protein